MTDDEKELIHVIPINDIREHESSIKCWCSPIQDLDEELIYIHNSLDGRESYENGRKMH